MPTEAEHRWLSPDAIATMLDIPIEDAENLWAVANGPSAYDFAGHIRYREDEVVSWVSECRVELTTGGKVKVKSYTRGRPAAAEAVKPTARKGGAKRKSSKTRVGSQNRPCKMCQRPMGVKRTARAVFCDVSCRNRYNVAKAKGLVTADGEVITNGQMPLPGV